jgi:hypothetical protein
MVFDTNVYISAAPGSRSSLALQLAAQGVFELVVSPDILAELRRKLSEPKFGFSKPELDDAAEPDRCRRRAEEQRVLPGGSRSYHQSAGADAAAGPRAGVRRLSGFNPFCAPPETKPYGVARTAGIRLLTSGARSRRCTRRRSDTLARRSDDPHSGWPRPCRSSRPSRRIPRS